MKYICIEAPCSYQEPKIELQVVKLRYTENNVVISDSVYECPMCKRRYSGQLCHDIQWAAFKKDLDSCAE